MPLVLTMTPCGVLLSFYIVSTDTYKPIDDTWTFSRTAETQSQDSSVHMVISLMIKNTLRCELFSDDFQISISSSELHMWNTLCLSLPPAVSTGSPNTEHPNLCPLALFLLSAFPFLLSGVAGNIAFQALNLGLMLLAHPLYSVIH